MAVVGDAVAIWTQTAAGAGGLLGVRDRDQERVNVPPVLPEGTRHGHGAGPDRMAADLGGDPVTGQAGTPDPGIGVDSKEALNTVYEAASELRAAIDVLSVPADSWVYRTVDGWPMGGWMAGSTAVPFLRLMGPELAQAILDWLCASARREDHHQLRVIEEGDEPTEAHPGDEMHAALRIAQAILRGTRDVDHHPGPTA